MNSSTVWKPFPARIHGLLARNQPIGVIIRRGPSRQVCTLGWNRINDEFTLAQWLKGRIYERRSDLSPNGKYLIYFAMNGRWNSETKGSWTAISRAPWLKAITLLGKGDCWHGGGLFTGDRTYWLNAGYGHQTIHDSNEVLRDTRDPVTAIGSYGSECLSVYYPRLQRDGWTYLGREKRAKHQHLDRFEKELPDGWVLRKIAHVELDAPPGKGCYWDAHELQNSRSGVVLQYPDWEWAEWDRSRLVWATQGCLYTGSLKRNLTDVRLLYDFNPLRFEARSAPY